MGPPPCSLQPLNLGPDSQSRAGHICGFPVCGHRRGREGPRRTLTSLTQPTSHCGQGTTRGAAQNSGPTELQCQ